MKSISLLKSAVLFASALAASGCMSISSSPLADRSGGKFVVQYSTMKMIESSETITAHSVKRTLDRIRKTVVNDEEIRYVDLKGRIMEEVHFDTLSESDRFLVTTLMENLMDGIDTGVKTDFISREDRVSIGRFLDWVEGAANMLV